MERKPIAALAAALAAAVAFASAGYAWAQKPAEKIDHISIATGAIGGIYNVMGGGMAKLLRERLGGIDVTAETTNASVDNVRLVGTRQADIGFSTTGSGFC